MTPTPYQLGEAAGLLHKCAGDSTVSYSLVGDLYVTPKNWVMLSVPNALVRGAFDALHEPGAELPFNDDGRLNAHVSVMRPNEVEAIGGADKITERGKQFRFTLGPLKEVKPDGWEGVSKVWFISIRSPELERLRRSYGLSSLPNDDKYELHCTVARRRVNVLRDNDVVKQSAYGPPYRCETCTKKFDEFPDGVDKCTACSGDLIPEQTFREKWPDRKFKLAALVSIPELDPAHPDYPTHAGPPLGGVSSASCHEPHDAARSGRADASGDGRPSAGGGGPAYVKGAAGETLAALLLAQQHSDHHDYKAKHRILSQLLRQSPQDFTVDQPHPAHPGLTHLPTGFRMHAPFSLAAMATGVPKTAKEKGPRPDDWNAPADRESCPHCHAMHERGDGFCNVCSARWPAVTKEAAGGKAKAIAGLFAPKPVVKAPKLPPKVPPAPTTPPAAPPPPPAPLPAAKAPVTAPVPVTPAPTAPVAPKPSLAAKAVAVPGNAIKNQFGFGYKGPVRGVNPFKPTASPFVARPTMAKGRALNPLEWGRFGLHLATRGLEQTGVGRAVGTLGRSALHALKTNPVRSLADAVRPGTGRFAAPLVSGAAAAPAVYAGYRAQRAVPDAVDEELQRAGVDEGIRNDQWWRTWGTQPKVLYHGLAPTWAGGDDTRWGRLSGHYVRHVVDDTPRDVDGTDLKTVAPTAGRAITQAPGRWLPTPSTVLKQTALKNVEDNLVDGQPAVLKATAKDFAADLRSDAPPPLPRPRTLAELKAAPGKVVEQAKQEAAWAGRTRDELARSPLVNDLVESIDPRLYNDQKALEAVVKTYAGDSSKLVADAVRFQAEMKGVAPPAAGMKFQYGAYYGRMPDGRAVSYSPKSKQWRVYDAGDYLNNKVIPKPPAILPYASAAK